MTVKELIFFLADFDPNAKVFVGCQGYTNKEDFEPETRVIMENKGNALVTDNGYYFN